MAAPWFGMCVLIAGGAGFIGSNLARRLVSLGARVRVLDVLLERSGGSRENLHGLLDQIDFHHVDVCDRDAIDPLFDGVNVVFNVVGLSGHRQSVGDPYADLKANTQAPLAVLDACLRRAPKASVVYASSRQIYGRAQSLPISESHPLAPLDINAIHTAAAESYHRVYADAFGLNTRVLRLTHTIGPGMRIKDARQSFVGLWIRCLLENRPFEVWGGGQRRDFCGVGEVVDALLALGLGAPDRRRVFNISGEVLSLLELAERLIKINGRGHYEVMEMPKDQLAIDLGDSWSDASRLAAFAALPPAQPLDEVLADTFAFYRERFAHYF